MEYRCFKLSDVDVEFIDNTSNNLYAAKEALPEVSLGETICVHFKEDAYTVNHIFTVEDVSDKISLKWLEMQDNALNEAAPIIKLDDQDMFNPDAVDFKDKIQKGIEQETEKEQAEKKAAEIAQFKEKNKDLIDILNSSDNTEAKLDKLFDKLVPREGAAHTVAGELVRAIMRILVRDYNDGDKFFEGYGLETCASSAQYLYDKGFNKQIASILDKSVLLSEDDNRYTDALIDLAKDVIETIANNNELLWTINEDDSRDYPTDFIEEFQPRYEFEIFVSDDVDKLLDAYVVTAWDLNSYVEDNLSWDSRYSDAEVERPWSQYSNTVTVSNLTKDGYDALAENTRNIDSYWESFVEDHKDELDDLESDEEDNDDYE